MRSAKKKPTTTVMVMKEERRRRRWARWWARWWGSRWKRRPAGPELGRRLAGRSMATGACRSLRRRSRSPFSCADAQQIPSLSLSLSLSLYKPHPPTPPTPAGTHLILVPCDVEKQKEDEEDEDDDDDEEVRLLLSVAVIGRCCRFAKSTFDNNWRLTNRSHSFFSFFFLVIFRVHFQADSNSIDTWRSLCKGPCVSDNWWLNGTKGLILFILSNDNRVKEKDNRTWYPKKNKVSQRPKRITKAIRKEAVGLSGSRKKKRLLFYRRMCFFFFLFSFFFAFVLHFSIKDDINGPIIRQRGTAPGSYRIVVPALNKNKWKKKIPKRKM